MTISGNNPGNIRYDANTNWRGADVPAFHAGFCRFKSLTYGVRAMAVLLVNYYRLHNLNTVDQLIARWAPPSENDTAAYIHDICARLKVYPDELLDIDAPDRMAQLVTAIAHHETGDMLPPDIVAAGVALALA